MSSDNHSVRPKSSRANLGFLSKMRLGKKAADPGHDEQAGPSNEGVAGPGNDAGHDPANPSQEESGPGGEEQTVYSSHDQQDPDLRDVLWFPIAPKLKPILNYVFKDYPDWDQSPRTPWQVRFLPPFEPVVHRWKEICHPHEHLGVLTALTADNYDDLSAFQQKAEPKIRQHLGKLDDAMKTGTITFDELWLILKPGSLFVTEVLAGDTCLSKLIRYESIGIVPGVEGSEYPYSSTSSPGPSNGSLEQSWRLTLGQVDWNGNSYGIKKSTVDIPRFEGRAAVTRLPVYPLDFVVGPKKRDIMHSAEDRGQTFDGLCRLHRPGRAIMRCKGEKYTACDAAVREPGDQVERVDGLVVVDAHAFYRCRGLVPDPLYDLADSSVLLDSGTSTRRRPDTNEILELTVDQKTITVPRVKGFDLDSKKWCEFRLSQLHQHAWPSRIFMDFDLGIDSDGLKMLTVLANCEDDAHVEYDSKLKYSQGGQRRIILLHGQSGTGKTQSVKAVSQDAHAPLYVLSARELGNSPRSVEQSLKRALKCCHVLKAILLIQHIDAFVEQPPAELSSNLETLNNKLARTVFFELLFHGQEDVIIFLTSDADHIPQDLGSRVDHLFSYRITPLTPERRRELWEELLTQFIKSEGGTSEVDVDAIMKLKDLQSFLKDERSIKNLFKTVRILVGRGGTLTESDLTHRALRFMFRGKTQIPMLQKRSTRGESIISSIVGRYGSDSEAAQAPSSESNHDVAGESDGN